MFGEGLDGRFGGVVGGVAGRVRDALFRARDDDGGRLAFYTGFSEISIAFAKVIAGQISLGFRTVGRAPRI